ncbi:hypothetical protein JW877_00685 [bacterium]|nr:hypothetical protein [bacterium]
MMFKYLCRVVILTLLLFCTSLLGQSFTMSINVYNDVEVSEVIFGTSPEATSGYDFMLDVPAFPLPFFFAYSQLSDTTSPLSQLQTDIRNSFDSPIIWEIYTGYATEDTLRMVWNPSMVPGFAVLKIGTHAPGDSVEHYYPMDSFSVFRYPVENVVQVYYDAEVEPSDDTIPPYALNWVPEDGATGVSGETYISVDILDDSSGVNSSSITLTVDLLPITMLASITPIPGGYNIIYEPFLPFGANDTIKAKVTACDMASPANCMADSIIFYTGTGDTTGFYYTVQGTVYLEGASEPDLHGSEVSAMDPFGGETFTDTTDDFGAYEIGGLTSGYKLITAQHTGYALAGSLVSVTGDRILNFNLSTSGIPGEVGISGFVLLADGSTILEGSIVTVDSLNIDTTNSEGYYSIRGLSLGMHTINVMRWGYLPQEQSVLLFADTTLNFTLEWDIPPQILIYDFDNGENSIDEGTVGCEIPIEGSLTRLAVTFSVTPQDADLTAYDLSLYDAVFLITGRHGGAGSPVPDSSLQYLLEFMDGGKSLYWEGPNAGHDYFGYPGLRGDFFERFGVNWEANGRPATEGNIRTLHGTGEIFNPIFEADYDFQSLADHYNDELTAAEAFMILESQEDDPEPLDSPGRVAAYDHTYKTIISTAYLGGISDAQVRDSVLAKYLDFLGITSGIKTTPGIKPIDYGLGQNYPNPFNAFTHIPFYTDPSHSGRNWKTISVKNILGQTIRTLPLTGLQSGLNFITWDGRDDQGNTVPGGLYFYKTEGDKEVKQMIFLK